ncbi:hypothetical protein [Streptomyces sp. 351MFTsu5.1]|nr:hypothetical protein [Streptomyces sp. 351MFTsu5.1]
MVSNQASTTSSVAVAVASRPAGRWQISDFVLEHDPLVRGHVYGR